MFWLVFGFDMEVEQAIQMCNKPSRCCRMDLGLVLSTECSSRFLMSVRAWFLDYGIAAKPLVDMLDVLIKAMHSVQTTKFGIWLFGAACRLTSDRRLEYVSVTKLIITDSTRKLPKQT